MGEDSFTPKRQLPKALEDTELSPGSVAGLADIRPPQQVIREEEAGAQQAQARRSQKGSLPDNIMEAVAVIKEMQEQGRRVELDSQQLMDFLKESKGDQISSDLLAATALLLGSIPEKRKEKKERLHKMYFRWAREASSVLITKVINTFKPKK